MLAVGAICAVAASLVFAAGMRTVYADQSIGVLHIETIGVSAVAVQKFETSLEEGLAGATDFTLTRRHELAKKMSGSAYPSGCLFGPCLKAIYRHSRVGLVLVARIAVIGPSYNFIITLLNTRTGNSTAQVTPGCDVCTLDEAISTATLAVIELMTDKSAAADPDLGATKHINPVELRRSLARTENNWLRRRRRLRATGYVFLVGAAVGVGFAAMFTSKDEKSLGYVAGGVGGALLVSGASVLMMSRKF